MPKHIRTHIDDCKMHDLHVVVHQADMRFEAFVKNSQAYTTHSHYCKKQIFMLPICHALQRTRSTASGGMRFQALVKGGKTYRTHLHYCKKHKLHSVICSPPGRRRQGACAFRHLSRTAKHTQPTVITVPSLPPFSSSLSDEKG